MGERTYTLSFSEQEFRALGAILDSGVRATGLQFVHDASAILRRLQEAERSAADAQQANGDGRAPEIEREGEHAGAEGE